MQQRVHMVPEVPPCWLPAQYQYCCGSVSSISTMNIRLQICTPAAARCSCWHVYHFRTTKMQFTIKWTFISKGEFPIVFFKSPKKHAALPSTHMLHGRGDPGWVGCSRQTTPSEAFLRPLYTELPSPQLGDWSFQVCLTDLEMNISKYVL